MISDRFNFSVTFKNHRYHTPLSPFQLPVNKGVMTIMVRFEFKNPKYNTELREVLFKIQKQNKIDQYSIKKLDKSHNN
jgi:hypothetical protein